MNAQEPKNEIDALGWQLARQMYGHNYAPSFGVIKIASAQSLEDVQQEIKKQYEKSKPGDASYEITDSNAMLKQVQNCFDYRGDQGAGLELTSEQETSLKETQQDFVSKICDFVSDSSIIYSTSIEEGLPIYYTFWHFAFVILNPEGESLFLFGAASD
ncbi:MAG: hypothetical protein JWP13_618 [Candidatus Saccharibacteria bacterium]|nr:hypothetical protein [Candidatus Saccharibacteria bacterium]